jgi:hypothetical protein
MDLSDAKGFFARVQLRSVVIAPGKIRRELRVADVA